MAEANGQTPPYVAFRTFWNFIQELHEHQPVPQVIDTSVLGSHRSGAARSQLLVALRFFDLIDAEKRPTAALTDLVADPSNEKLRAMLEKHYKPAIELGLKTATPAQLDSVLGEMGGGQGSTVRKARTFFLSAAEEAGIEVGRTLKQSSGPAAPARRTSRARPRRQQPPPEPPDPPRAPDPREGSHPLIKGLLMELPEGGAWSAAERQRWLDAAGLIVDMLYEVEGSKPNAAPPVVSAPERIGGGND